MTDLTKLIAQTPYQQESVLGGVTPNDSGSGVPPSADTPGQGPAGAGLSPTQGNVAHQGQPAPRQEPDGSSASQPSADDRDERIRRLEETLQSQSTVVNEATRRMQEIEANRLRSIAQERERQFMAQLQDLPEVERRAAIAERRAFIAEQQLTAQRQQAARTEHERQESAKRLVAIDTAAAAGLPIDFVDALMVASDPDDMRARATDYVRKLQEGGYGTAARAAAQQAQTWDQQAQYVTPMGQQPQELPSAATPGLGESGPTSQVPRPANGSGDIMGLIRATPYTVVRSRA